MATLDLGKIKQVWRGTYNNSTAYVVDDLVAYTDSGITSTYICVANSTGNAPSSSGTAHASWNYVAKGVVDPIPSQSGNAGKVLKTDGTSLSFGQGGGVVQVQYQIYTPTASIGSTSTTFAATGLTKAITPTSASNKIKIEVNIVLWCDAIAGSTLSAGAGLEGQLQLTRDDGSATTDIGKTEWASWSGIEKMPACFVVWDTTHNSTSALTYAVNFRRRAIYSGNQAVYVHNQHHDTASITLTEYAV